MVGPKTIAIAGSSYNVTELEDRSDVDSPATRMYVDASGLPLRWTMTDQQGREICVQRTTAEAIAKRFAPELKRFESR